MIWAHMQAHDSSREAVREKVRAGYRQIALHGSERRKSSSCNGMSAVDSEKLACQIGYSVEELAGLPDVKIIAHLPPGKKPGDYITSLEITARKPALGDKMGAPAAEVFESGSCCCSAKNQ